MKTNREILYGVPTNIYEKDTYLGFTYYIVESYSFPCAYVVVPKKDKGVKKVLDFIVHGSITYSKDSFYLDNIGKGNWVLGWDYGHGGDFIYFDDTFTLTSHSIGAGKVYKREDIIEDVENVIDAIIVWREFDEESK